MPFAGKRYFKKRGIDYRGFHKFRYTYAAHWIQSNGNPFELKEQLGHSSLAMTQRYTQVFGAQHAKPVQEHSLINTVKARRKRKIQARESN